MSGDCLGADVTGLMMAWDELLKCSLLLLCLLKPLVVSAYIVAEKARR